MFRQGEGAITVLDEGAVVTGLRGVSPVPVRGIDEITATPLRQDRFTELVFGKKDVVAVMPADTERPVIGILTAVGEIKRETGSSGYGEEGEFRGQFT